MALGYFTLTGSFNELDGGDSVGLVRVEATPRFLVDPVGNSVKLSPKHVTLVAGAFTIGLPTDVTTGVSATIQYRVVIQLHGHPPFEVTFWALAATSTVDITGILSGVYPGAPLRVLVDTDGVFYYAAAGVGSRPLLTDTDTQPYVGAVDAVGGAVILDTDGVPYSTV